MRLILLGAGEFGLPTFEALTREHEVVAVVSQPDKPAGRSRKLTPPPVAAWSTAQGLRLFQWPSVNVPEAVAALADCRADAAVVIAFGQKLGQPLLQAMGPLTVNLHGSVLPRWRGASPIQAAIIAGDTSTGVSVIALADRMDAGEVYASRSCPIQDDQTAGDLHDALAALGPAVVREVLNSHAAGALWGVLQDEALVTCAPKLTKDDAWVDFTVDARMAARRINGLNPWPGVTMQWRSSTGEKNQALLLRRARVFTETAHSAEPGTMIQPGVVACGSGAVELLELQKPGGKLMPASVFLRGQMMAAGDVLSRS